MSNSNRRAIKFYFVDVFATEPFSGNPLAIVPDADFLHLDTMQKIAREFNLSETTFILKPTTAEADWRLRSFTPTGAEVFGAGHNALGAWWWLAESGVLPLAATTHFIQEIGKRCLPVAIAVQDDRPVSVAMTQGAPVKGDIVRDSAALAAALGLAATDLALDLAPAQVISTGAAHLMVPVRDVDTVDRIKARSDELFAVLRAVGGQGCYAFAVGARHAGAHVYARFFNPTVGIWEDPATGSAAGPLATHLAANGFLKGETLVIEQGTAMGRTSLIHVSLSSEGPQVAGGGITVANGTLLT
jgi:trans-2,3-dihydro-3-hydroxyanthranilate isomerase